MKIYKILALMYVDLMLMKNTKWRTVEYIYFPLTTVIIWGLFSIFVKSYALEAGLIVLVVNILWNFAYLAQSHVNMQINEDSWSGSLKQIIITGVGDFEYIVARILSAAILSLATLVLMLAVAFMFFDISVILSAPGMFSILILITLLASIGMSIFVAGAMVALGKEYGFLAWTILQMFILLSAPFYPVSVFPEFIKPLVLVMPYTNVFEATRNIISGTPDIMTVFNAFYVAMAYVIASAIFYRYVLKKARMKGWLVRLS